MTTASVLRAIATRWYVVLLGLALTLALAVVVHRSSGVYETRVDVQLLPPLHSARYSLVYPRAGLTSLAGLVDREIDPGDEWVGPISPEVGLAGMGIRHGSRVFLPNYGGQWDYYFARPVLRVQAVSSSEEAAVALRDQRVQQVLTTIDRLQAEEGISERRRVRTHLVPAHAPVEYVVGSPGIATGLSVGLGLALTVATCALLDVRLRRRGKAVARLAATAEPVGPVQSAASPP